MKLLPCQKSLFSLEEDVHYLNCAYLSPLLRSAEDAAREALVRLRNPSSVLPTDFFNTVDAVKSEFASIVNCRSSQVAVVPSVSYGMSTVINNIPFEKGKHLLSVKNEFPSSIFNAQRWAAKHGGEIRIVDPNEGEILDPQAWNQRVIEAIDENTAAVLIGSAHWMYGSIFDLEKIGEACRSHGALLIVDGSQSVGALPLNLENLKIDALICAGYKWLFGPYSISLAYIGEAFNDGVPLEESWMNRTNAHDFTRLTDYDPHYTPDAGRYTMGEVSNMVTMPMMLASLKQINEWSPAGIQQYSRYIRQPLDDYLKANGASFEHPEYLSSHIMRMTLPGIFDMDMFNQNLISEKVFISRRGEAVRVSFNVFNTESDVNKMIEVLERSKK
jgi:selenocysteine lyase/cysteine desulfurase